MIIGPGVRHAGAFLCYPFSVNIFFLDIASKNGTLACVTPERVVAMHTVDTKIGDADLPRLIEAVWMQAGWKPKDMTHVACCTGPGGFMSLRVGVSSANALAWGLGLPSCGIHLSDLYEARRMPSPRPSGTPLPTNGRGAVGEGILWLHSTKKEELFVRGFGSHQSAFPQPEHVTVSALEARLPDDILFMGELLPEHEAWLQTKGGTRSELHPLNHVLPSFLSVRTYERQTLMPWYGREG